MLMVSIADILELLESSCVPPYFSPESYSNILGTARPLPASLSLRYMFERQLEQPSAPIDFSALVLDDNHREILAGVREGIPARFYDHEVWRRIRDFARAWLDSGPGFREVCSFWLEFDVRSRPGEVPIPIVFFTVDSNVSPKPGLEILQGDAFDSPKLETLRRCWDAIPATCRYRTIGVPYSRLTEAIRVICVTTPGEAFKYLATIGWPGSVGEVIRQATPFLGFHDQIALHVDAHPEGIEPQLGMEIYADQYALYYGRGGDCAPLLAAAVDESLCLPEIRDALLAWPGSNTVKLKGGAAIQVDRMFHHLKLVSRAGSALRAKAYTTSECEVLL